MKAEAREWSPEDLRVGMTASFEREVTQAEVDAFAAVSGDFNPLHVDPAYAARTSLERTVAHGALQVALASAMAGMHLPGRRCLLLSMQARFAAPLYVPCRVLVQGEIVAWSPEQRSGQLKVLVLDAGHATPCGEVVVGFTVHDGRGARDAVASPPVSRAAAAVQGRVVLVTGAAGGLGSAIVADLMADHDVIAVVNERSLPPEIEAERLTVVRADLRRGDWDGAVREALVGRSLYGVVHAAWPGAPAGGLLDAPDAVVEQQLAFGGTQLIRLARMLAERSAATGGRLVAISSLFARRPHLTLSAYSLGKAVLEKTTELLAPELARRSITVNAVAPSFVATGMNRAVSERQRKVEAARIPLGRLCSPADVAHAVRFLLSPPSEFISGQVLVLAGGALG